MANDKTNDLRRLTGEQLVALFHNAAWTRGYNAENEELKAELLRRLSASSPVSDLSTIVAAAVDKCNPSSDGERFCLYNIIEAACKEAQSAPRLEAPGPLIELNAAQEEMLKGWAEHDRGTALWGNSEARLINLRTVARMTLKLANGEAK